MAKALGADAGDSKPADALLMAVQHFGVPSFPGTAAETATMLLGAAAEIEQQLMVEYLYGWFSASNAPLEWRTRLRTVFREEMGHLLTVQNLLLLTKNTPHFARMSGVAEAHQPFPLRLEPLSRRSVAKYVSGESPDPATLPAELQPDAAQALAEATAAGFTGNRVGVLYAAIYWLLQSDETPAPPWILPAGVFENKHLADADFAPGSIAYQGLPSDWRAQAAPQPAAGFFVAQAADRQAALNAVYEVSQQGEGIVTVTGNEISHFQQFLTLYRAIVAFAGPLPVQPVPVDPTYGDAVLPDANAEENRISAPGSQGLAELSDLHYVILLGCIHLSLLVPNSATGAAFRKALAKHAITGEMVGALGELGRELGTMPRKQGDNPAARAAGIPFSDPSLPQTEDQQTLAQFILDRVHNSDVLIDQLLPGLPQQVAVAVQAIKDDGTTLRTLLSQLPIA